MQSISNPLSARLHDYNRNAASAENGVDIIKLFPGSVSGPSIVSAVKAPLPHANLMPTGGVNLENMQTWFEAGVVAVGVGGNLLAPAAEGISLK